MGARELKEVGMLLLCRLRFLVRWVFVYNIRLVWLNLRLPKVLGHAQAMPAAADKTRRDAHNMLAKASEECNKACANCGTCCAEDVDRFTAFDYLVRRNTNSPAPSWDGKIYSIWWMISNAVSHGVQRALRRSEPEALTCRHHSEAGCALAREDRPMICVSWYCAKAALAMSRHTIEASERPLRIIEALHVDALRSARHPSVGFSENMESAPFVELESDEELASESSRN
jgi:hypothetical protein